MSPAQRSSGGQTRRLLAEKIADSFCRLSGPIAEVE
jgi:hypothetical protein